MKIQKKKIWGGGGEVRGGGVWLVGGGGEVRVCERRIEFFVKIQKKKNLGGGVRGGGGVVLVGGGVRVDVNKELKFL